MTARLLAFIVWAALAASAVFWGLRLGSSSPVAPSHAVPAGASVPPRGDLTRIFGAAPPPAASEPSEVQVAEASSRFQLVGVVAPRGGGAGGVALLGVDGKPPKPYRTGAAVDGQLVVQQVAQRSVTLGPRGGAAEIRIELPPLAPAATGTLPPPVSNEEASPPVPPPPPVVPPQVAPQPTGVPPLMRPPAPTVVRPLPGQGVPGAPPAVPAQQDGAVVPVPQGGVAVAR